jgi:5-hmdU DNA kinase, helical domain
VINEKILDLYTGMVEERHKIWLARQNGEPQPWTEDPVLKNRKFTNMFRVLDPGSQFVFDLDSDDPVTVIARLVFYRITNLPSTWYAIRVAHGRYPTAADFIHNSARLFQVLDAHRRSGNRIFSGAYIIVPEPGTTNDKVAGALRLTTMFIREKADAFIGAQSQETRFNLLRSTPGLGKFLSMQILTDWGYLQSKTPDLSFVVAGPGAVRGAALIDPTSKPEDMIYDLTCDWMDHSSLRLGGRSLTMMDVQNTLCEFSKYAREIASPRKKTKYRASHPGTQPGPILPAWW